VEKLLEQALPQALAKGLISDEQPLICLVDKDGVRAAVHALKDAFPAHFTHTFAAKANSMRQALELVRDCGMGCEVASHGELAQAMKAGFAPSDIVHDEPAKTQTVLRSLLSTGVGLNMDSLQEFDRVRALLAQSQSTSEIGFRVNPQVGTGTISAMSTATVSSKFGIALEDSGNREQLIAAFIAHPWLTTLHCHVGSQGCALELMISGIRKVVDLALLINRRAGAQRVQTIDIGGGLPVNFRSDLIEPTFADFAGQLAAAVPELFDGQFRVKTEFGRSLFAKNGVIFTRVEYTKSAGGRHIAVTHAGAQVATRTVFMPKHWAIRLAVFDASGARKQSREIMQDIAGPLCFSGDMLATGRKLPETKPGDIVALLDTGAYYFSMPFYYNALPAPAVYGIERDKETDKTDLTFGCWRPAQPIEHMLDVIG
jgi:diaminopimelate decarboxylase